MFDLPSSGMWNVYFVQLNCHFNHTLELEFLNQRGTIAGIDQGTVHRPGNYAAGSFWIRGIFFEQAVMSSIRKAILLLRFHPSSLSRVQGRGSRSAYGVSFLWHTRELVPARCGSPKREVSCLAGHARLGCFYSRACSL